jgi:hypothetical protein
MAVLVFDGNLVWAQMRGAGGGDGFGGCRGCSLMISFGGGVS